MSPLLLMHGPIVTEVVSEYERVVVRPLILLAILSAVEKSERPLFFPELLSEQLPMAYIDRPILRKMVFIVGQC